MSYFLYKTDAAIVVSLLYAYVSRHNENNPVLLLHKFTFYSWMMVWYFYLYFRKYFESGSDCGRNSYL